MWSQLGAKILWSCKSCEAVEFSSKDVGGAVLQSFCVIYWGEAGTCPHTLSRVPITTRYPASVSSCLSHQKQKLCVHLCQSAAIILQHCTQWEPQRLQSLPLLQPPSPSPCLCLFSLLHVIWLVSILSVALPASLSSHPPPSPSTLIPPLRSRLPSGIPALTLTEIRQTPIKM